MSDPAEFDQVLQQLLQCQQQLDQLIEQPLRQDLAEADQQQQIELLQQWQLSLDLLQQRGILVNQLNGFSKQLSELQQRQLADCYQQFLATNQQHLEWAEAEQVKVRNALRAIKNAAKALPIYQLHNQ